jgi:hypothetical protein
MCYKNHSNREAGLNQLFKGRSVCGHEQACPELDEGTRDLPDYIYIKRLVSAPVLLVD